MGLDIWFDIARVEDLEKNGSRYEELQNEREEIYRIQDFTEGDKKHLQEVRNEIKRITPWKNVLYFYKVNFLVDFFSIDNQVKEITKEDVCRLIDCCEQVLADHEKASDLLPTVSGFFFGSTDYDEYYFDDVQDVLNKFKKLMTDTDGLKDTKLNMTIWY